MSAQIGDFTIRLVAKVCEESVLDEIVNQARFALIDPSLAILTLLFDNIYFPPAAGSGRLYYQVASVIGSRSARLVVIDGSLIFELLTTAIGRVTPGGRVREMGPGALAVRGLPVTGMRYNIGRMSVAFDLARGESAVYVFISFGGISYGYRSTCGTGIPTRLQPILELLAEAYEQRLRQQPAVQPAPPPWWGLPGVSPQPVSPGMLASQTARELTTYTSMTYMTEAELREQIVAEELARRIASSTIKAVVSEMCEDYWQYKPESAFRLHVVSGSATDCLFAHARGRVYLCKHGEYSLSPYCFISKAIAHVAYYGYARITELSSDIDYWGPAYYALEGAFKRVKKRGITFDELLKGAIGTREEWMKIEPRVKEVMEATEKMCDVKLHNDRTSVAIRAFIIASMLKDLSEQTVSLDEIIGAYIESNYTAGMRFYMSSIQPGVDVKDVLDFIQYVLSVASQVFDKYAGKETGVIGASVAGTINTISLSKSQLCTVLGIASANPML